MAARGEGGEGGGGPVGVGVGVRHDNQEAMHARAEDRDVIVVKKHRHHCRTVIIHNGDMTKKIRKCGGGDKDED